ncbi:MAG: hypothetical protein M1836_002649 [Candelina mexicana]|nr:MAG: hypothetical protein M1836_002649 [Candelina mexicana]
MFKKKPNIKPLSPLRSSDRRRTADQIIADLQLDPPQAKADEEGQTDQNEATSSLPAFRSSLLPEGSQFARFTTTAGPDLKQVSGTVYVGAFPGQEQRILWVKMEERMFPTVYTLWHNPRLIPLLHTSTPVLQKLRGGADLMTPGLLGPPFPSGATKGALVAIASPDNSSVPMVVGVCAIDIRALKAVQGEKGRAVRVVHWDGDELWAWSAGAKTGGAAPEYIKGWGLDEDTEVENATKGVSRLHTQDDDGESGHDDGGVALRSYMEHSVGTKERNQHVEGENVPLFEEVEVDEKELSTKEIDEAFRNAFLYSVYHHKLTNKDEHNFGFDFPVPQTLVISNLVLPFLPIFTSAQAASLQIKKTSWKNVKKFVKSLDKEQLIKSKDRNGGETVILDIDFDDRAFTTFVPYRLPKKEPTAVAGGGVEASGRTAGDDSIGQELKRMELYRPKEKLSPIFDAVKSSIKSLYLSSELRAIVISYIELENLVSATNKRLINLDPVLANAVFDSKASLDNEVLEKGSAPRDIVINRVVQSCSPFYAILRGEETREDAKPKSGKAPTIQILLETRSGNKTVTKISGVEVYNIHPQSLGDELQKVCASSTSVNQLVGSSPKHPVMEILVQGPQKEAVTKALEKRGVNRQWIEVVDKTKKKK